MKNFKIFILTSVQGLIFYFVSSHSFANSLEAEISALVKQEWNTIQQKKSLPSKLSDDLLAITQHGLPKNLDDRKAAVIQASGLSVMFIAQEKQGEDLEKFLVKNGVTIQFRSQDTILAVTSSEILKKIATSPLLLSASIQGIVENQNNITSLPTTSLSSSSLNDGVQATYVHLLHEKGFKGQGIKVGIIDFGFAYYPILQQKNFLPNAKKIMTFANGQQVEKLDTAATDSVHGTGTTEIIYNMAPQADFYLAQIGNGRGVASDGDVILAIDWLIQQGVNIINFSGGGHSSAHDGTSPLDKKVQQAFQQGVLWVNAAGNEGKQHWMGLIQDQNKNHLIDVAPEGDYLILKKTNAGNLYININWDDWFDSKKLTYSIDVNALLLTQDINTGKLNIIAKANSPRVKGSSALETISTRVAAGTYYLALTSNQYIPRNIHVFVKGAEISHRQAMGSVGIPATSEAALAVAAWDVKKKQIADYSSHGTTDDGRIKPDISAPTNTNNQSYKIAYNSTYTGTSAASPHAAGFAASYWSFSPHLTAIQLKEQLKKSVVTALSSTIPSPASGYGLLDARKIDFNIIPSPQQSNPTTLPPNKVEPMPNKQPEELNPIRQFLRHLGIK